MTAVPPRELLCCWVYERFAVLVPRQRGVGFLKVPLGHHQNPALERVADRVQCDVMGLDGALEFVCPGEVYHGGAAQRDAFAAQIVPALEAHYGWPAREVMPSEFWARHPIGLRG